jgi:BirA family biotin operon repressor/biotin-[acetyl-CoA-carboxylase] ligase
MTLSPRWSIHRFATLPSTMDQARELAQSGAPELTVVIASEQTQGRGRSSRPWHSPPGAGLYCTLVLRPAVAADRLSTLPLVVGVAVAEAIESQTGREAKLKWPNDVWLDTDRATAKVAGILTTSSLCGSEIDYVLVGIGINVTTPEADLPPGATSILAASGVRVSADDLLSALLERFDGVYARYLDAAGRPSLAAFRHRAAMLGEQVSIEQGGTRLVGRYVDVDDDGALLLERNGRSAQRVVAGDLVRGPRATGDRRV